MRPHRGARQSEAAGLRPATSWIAPAPSRVPSFVHAAFHAQQLLGQLPARSTPPPHRAAILAYHAHLAARIRFYGPLTPLDLRV
jgi:hypothetical protein